ncbi:MAG: hypothetical protein KatS3mg056_3316 [Chloroflexus sp.]|nr:MAG: hypothetical protein KatS3mg056_3316 [Chloroflexus sp.]
MMKKRMMPPMKQILARVKGWVTRSSRGYSVRSLVGNNPNPIVSSAIPRKVMGDTAPAAARPPRRT